MGYIISLDHDQLEPRVQAHIYSKLGDDSWAETYWFKEEWERKHPGVYNPRADIYAVVGSVAYRVKLDSITSKKHPVRKRSKPLTLGMSYGLTPYGLAWRIGCSEEEAAGIIRTLFRGCPGMPKYFSLTREEVIKYERCETMFGKILHLPFDKRDRWSFESAFRRGINVKIQGPASDITLSGMVDFEEKYHGLAMLVPGRDEVLVAEVHDNLTYDMFRCRLLPKLKWHMTHPSLLETYKIKFRVPLQVDEKKGSAWD